MTYFSAQNWRNIDRYLPLYRRAGSVTGAPWRLLAAMHYRENLLSGTLGLNLTSEQCALVAHRRGVKNTGDLAFALICLGDALQQRLAAAALPALTSDSSEDEQCAAANLLISGEERPSAYTDHDPQGGVSFGACRVGIRAILRELARVG